MALEMRTKCERCEGFLGLRAEAFICTYECTFCPACTEAMRAICPNCGGELVHRPRRKVEVVAVDQQTVCTLPTGNEQRVES